MTLESKNETFFFSFLSVCKNILKKYPQKFADIKYLRIFVVQSKKIEIMTTTKIISRRELAIKLSNGKVSVDQLSKKVEKTVELWLSRKEVVLENGYLKLAQ